MILVFKGDQKLLRELCDILSRFIILQCYSFAELNECENRLTGFLLGNKKCDRIKSSNCSLCQSHTQNNTDCVFTGSYRPFQHQCSLCPHRVADLFYFSIKLLCSSSCNWLTVSNRYLCQMWEGCVWSQPSVPGHGEPLSHKLLHLLLLW